MTASEGTGKSTYNRVLEDLINSVDMDMALMEYDTINGTALLSQWEIVQNTFDMEN